MDAPSRIGVPYGVFRKVLKVLLGLLFVVSAILKVVDMDPFEIYVFSYGFFSLNVSFVVARLAIILELVLGIGLISNCLHKLMWWGSVLMLLGYTGLMAYAMIQGRTDNCHCFGDLLQFDPLRSLLKNLVLLLLFGFLYAMEGKSFRGQWPALAAVTLACFLGVFLASPPDFMLRNETSGQLLQRPVLEEAMQEAPLAEMELDQGKKVVCFFSTGCELCRMTARKLSLMQGFHGFPEEAVCYVFMGTEAGVQAFFAESESSAYPYVIYEDTKSLLKIVDGKFPVVALMQAGTVVREYGFRDLDEKEIKNFFQN